MCSKARFGEHTQPTCKRSSRVPAAGWEGRELRSPPGRGCSLCPGPWSGQGAEHRCVPPSATPTACASPPPVTSYIMSRANRAGSQPNRHGASAGRTPRGRRCRDRHPLSSLSARPGALLEKSRPGRQRLPHSRQARSPPRWSPVCLPGEPRASPPAPAPPERLPGPAALPCPARPPPPPSLLSAELEEKVTRRRPGVRRRRSSRAMSRSTTCYDT